MPGRAGVLLGQGNHHAAFFVFRGFAGGDLFFVGEKKVFINNLVTFSECYPSHYQMTVSEYNKAVDLYSDNIYRFVVKHLSDDDKAKDVIQDVFEKVYEMMHEVNPSKYKSAVSAVLNVFDLPPNNKNDFLTFVRIMSTSLIG